MSDVNNKQWFENKGNSSNKKSKTNKKGKKHPANSNMPKKDSNIAPNKNSLREPDKSGNKNRVVNGNPNKNHVPVNKSANNGNPIKADNKIQDRKPIVTKTSTANSKPSNKKVVPTKKKKLKFGFKKKAKKAVVTPVPTNEEVNNSAPKASTGFDKNKAKLERKKRGKRSALNSALLAVSVTLLIIALLTNIIHYLFDYIAAKPELTFITNGSVEHTIGARAMIVRDELLIPTETDGDLITQAAEGSRVYSSQSIAMVVPADMQTIVDSLHNTQSQISQVQQELIQQGLADGADAIYDNFNDSLNPIIDMIRLDSMNGKISGMSSYSSSVSVLLNQRETALAALDFDDERLRVLRNDEAAYETQLSRNATTIRTTSPGVVSFRLDGLESVLNFNVLLEADSGVVYDYINDAQGVISADLVVSSGDYVARIASNEEQYIACFLDDSAATAEAFAVGTRHTINIGSEGISIGKCIVERVEPTTRGLYVVFSTTRYVESLLDLRTVDIEVVINETTGLRVPISSLVNPDFERNIATIYVNNQGFCDEVSVIIEDYDREFAIIAPIGDNTRPNLNTVIITNPSSINPGEKVE